MNLSGDNWDDVVNYESNEFKLGIQEGIIDGKESGFRKDGNNAGFIKGYGYGIELGFYEAAVNHYLNTPVRNTSSSSSSSNVSIDRIDKRAQQLRQKISNIKATNDNDIDYDHEIQTIRSLYKSLNLPFGSFLSAVSSEPIGNVTADPISNENNPKGTIQISNISW